MTVSSRAQVRVTATVAFLLASASCVTRDVDPDRSEGEMPEDIHSFARPGDARVTHLSLDLVADFDARVLHGTATLDVWTANLVDEIVLDSNGLDVQRITTADGRPVEYDVCERDEVLGSPIVVHLSDGLDRFIVHYRTRPKANAVQWLRPEQTAGDRPFLFTQGQAILTRTWIPLQDTPSVRHTYDARITVPAGLVPVMSAERLTPDGEPAELGRAYRFRMPVAIPSYLIALAIGDLAIRELGPRCGVVAEPTVIDAAAHEFADTEKMIAAAERLYGPYRWGRYDILVLPASFPFGGMENPCLTFATPTIIAGDRSLVALVAHELAHSWSGNLVTNAVWADLWLNEGFTVYFENRIMEELYGEPYARMLRVLGWQDLHEDFDTLGLDGKDTRLNVDLAGRNPDDAFSNVPYEKGALFLRTIESIVGRERFDAFVSDYFDRFAFQPMTSARFLQHLRTRLFDGRPNEWEQLRAEEWVYEPGLPANAVMPTSDAFARVDTTRQAMLATGEIDESMAAAWSTHEWVHFLRGIPPELPTTTLIRLDETFHLSASRNSEIQFEWLRIAIRNRYEPAFPGLEEFLTRQGRRKFLKPLYSDLVKTEWGRTLARRIYDRARPLYHAVSSNTIDDVLAKAGA